KRSRRCQAEMITRRKFLVALAASFACLCRDNYGQTPVHIRLLGLLPAGGRAQPDGGPPKALRDALQSLGYVEGRDITYEARFAQGKLERLPGMASDLVRLPVDVIVTQGGLATLAAKRATSTIPIVMAPAAGDAVAPHLVPSS